MNQHEVCSAYVYFYKWIYTQKQTKKQKIAQSYIKLKNVNEDNKIILNFKNSVRNCREICLLKQNETQNIFLIVNIFYTTYG